MVHHVLSLQPERVPLTVNGILEVMSAYGVTPESAMPRNTVKTALNRRSTKERDVIHTGLGEWGLVSWYSPSEIEKFERGQDGSKARDAKMHKTNMKKGIAAAQARCQSRVIRKTVGQIKAAKPAVGKIQMYLIAKPSFGSDAKAITHKKHPDQ